MYKEDTIAAIATPPGEGGVAIVRVSGPDAEEIAAKLFIRDKKINDKLESHRLYYGKIVAPETNRVMDQVLLTLMRKPRSYTGEDVVEIHCHGGAFLTRQMLGLILASGARQADPGEFTKRAFLNGRLDLAQAEAVLDLIEARTDKGAALALDQVSGGLSKWLDALREELLDILVQVEAAIDFPDEDIELLQRRDLAEKLTALADKIHVILEGYDWGRLYREGARVAIAGRPNVGKSSLLNALLGEDRVIVTPVPGTTRDVIEESINLLGLPAVLWDTAGIRDTDDQVEQIGVRLARRHVEKADAVLVVLDGSQALNEADLAFNRGADKKTLIAINKIDLPQAFTLGDASKCFPHARLAGVSAKTGAGIDELKLALRELLLGAQSEPDIVITNVRHAAALTRSERALRHATEALIGACPPEFAAVDLNGAREALEEIVGVISNDDILERIFSKFCIGK
jgi:tRNA modification GTPase